MGSDRTGGQSRPTNRYAVHTPDRSSGHSLNPVRLEPPNPGRPRHASSGWGEAPLQIEQHELRVQQVKFVRGEYRRPVLGDVLPSDRTRRLGKEALVIVMPKVFCRHMIASLIRSRLRASTSGALQYNIWENGIRRPPSYGADAA